jgi:hypothetical protein
VITIEFHFTEHQERSSVLEGFVGKPAEEQLKTFIGESHRVEVTSGQIDWEEPSARVHRAVNVGKQPYEQVTIFLLDRPDAVPQPVEE